MIQILSVGSLESDNEMIVKAEKGIKEVSGQISQKNIIYGIEAVTGMPVDTINGSIVPHYPAYQDKIVPEICWESESGASNISVSYRNIKYLNRLTCRRSMGQAADQWCKEKYNGGELTVFIYGLRSAPLAAGYRIKKRIPSAKLYLIVTDLPKYMDMGESKVKKFLKKIDWLSMSAMLPQIDGYILYAAPIAQYLGIPDDRWVLMEGSYDISEKTMLTGVDVLGGHRVLMYSGRLDEQYGISMLLDAFMEIRDDQLELWLTGSGNAEEYIRKCVSKDPRIKMLGFLPSRKDVLERQQRATVLLNMRMPSQSASAYCFPSKLFEYMATGKPVLSFRIAGIPDEYFKYLIPVESEDTASLKKAIEQALSLSKEERLKMGNDAMRFIREVKNRNAQAMKICRFVGLKMNRKEENLDATN